MVTTYMSNSMMDDNLGTINCPARFKSRTAALLIYLLLEPQRIKRPLRVEAGLGLAKLKGCNG